MHNGPVGAQQLVLAARMTFSSSAAVDVGATSLERCAGSPRIRFRTAAGAWVPRTNAQRTRRSRRTRPRRPPAASDRAPPPVPGSPRRRRDTSGFGRSGTALRRRAFRRRGRCGRANALNDKTGECVEKDGRSRSQRDPPDGLYPRGAPPSSSRSGARARGRRLTPGASARNGALRPLREHLSLGALHRPARVRS